MWFVTNERATAFTRLFVDRVWFAWHFAWLTWASSEICCLLDIWSDDHIAQQLEKYITITKCSKCQANGWRRGNLTDVIFDQWTQWHLPHRFCWYILICLKFSLCETKLNQKEIAGESQLLRWFESNKPNYRCENTFRKHAIINVGGQKKT